MDPTPDWGTVVPEVLWLAACGDACRGLFCCLFHQQIDKKLLQYAFNRDII